MCIDRDILGQMETITLPKPEYEKLKLRAGFNEESYST